MAQAQMGREKNRIEGVLGFEPFFLSRRVLGIQKQLNKANQAAKEEDWRKKKAMVSQRQRLAKKRFKEANPHLFPKPEPPASDATNTKKKKSKQKNKFKKKNKDAKQPLSTSGSRRKHPLRVPGMRPGESCFICKSADHIAKHCPEKAQWERNKICLFCRRRGHSVKNCPGKPDSAAAAATTAKFCYNCGQSGHNLSHCPQPLQDGGTKFASCFICTETGHLSKNCPKNEHGIYPKGGCCKVCGGVTHLAKHCPNKHNGGFADSMMHEDTEIPEVSRQNDLTSRRGGDDLEDDFIEHVQVKNVTTNASAKSKSKSGVVGKDEKNSSDAKAKKAKQGPKVVNFLG